MPKFSIREYHTYVDVYEVEASDLPRAFLLMEAYSTDTAAVTKVADRIYNDNDCTYGCEIFDDGSYGDSEELG